MRCVEEDVTAMEFRQLRFSVFRVRERDIASFDPKISREQLTQEPSGNHETALVFWKAKAGGALAFIW